MKETNLTMLGEETLRAPIYKSESHKLHQSFTVKNTKKIYQGQPVALNGDGTVQPYTGSDGEVYLGIAVTDSINPAYQPQYYVDLEVTVAVEGFMICNWVSAGALSAGYVDVKGTMLSDHFPIAATAAAGKATNFIALNSASKNNEVIQVLVK